MRDLYLDVSGMTLQKDKNCDFSNVVRGSKRYLRLKFCFDNEWFGYDKVAQFSDSEFIKLDRNNSCVVPDSVCGQRGISVRVIGVRNDQEIRTNIITIMQKF